MSLFIRNTEAETAARELAQLQGKTLTEAVRDSLKATLEAERAKPRRRPTVDEILAATDEFRRKAGLDKVKLNVTKADFDALWEIPGFDPENPFS